VSGKDSIKQNTDNLNSLFNNEGTKAIDVIVEASNSGLPKNDMAIYALALAASHSNSEVRCYALQQLPKVCRIATHLFTFLTYVKEMRGFGRGLKNAIANWYNSMEANRLAQQVCKYGSRRVKGELPWSHRDALRVAHPIAKNDNHNKIYRYIVKPSDVNIDKFKRDSTLEYIYWHEKALHATTVAQVVEAIEKGGVTHESINKELLNNREVYDALVQNMPYTAMIRNLGKMTEVRTLQPLGVNTKLVCEKLTDEEGLQKARVHPMNLLIALKTYKSGHGFIGSLSWNPISQVSDALEDAFYKSFKFVQPTGKNILVGVDVSGSMYSSMSGTMLSCCEGAAAMAMTIARTEQNYHIMAFANNFVNLGVTAKTSLTDAIRKSENMNFGSTDCALPMIYAQKNKLDVDAFVVITDCETRAGNIKPCDALKQYRRSMNKSDAKLIVIGMTATNFTIADPKDRNSLDVVGFDASTPQILADFIADRI
jgi:60 kDa SS-A/Ro ribonucleoprotein